MLASLLLKHAIEEQAIKGGKPIALQTDGAHVGSMAPDFTLAGSNGQISLSDYCGKQNVVLYFMREFSCSFCQKHVAQLKQLYSILQAHHAEVLVIGGGSRAEAEQLATQLQVPFPVLHYPGEKVLFYPLIFYVHIFKYVLIRPHHVQGAG